MRTILTEDVYIIKNKKVNASKYLSAVKKLSKLIQAEDGYVISVQEVIHSIYDCQKRYRKEERISDNLSKYEISRKVFGQRLPYEIPQKYVQYCEGEYYFYENIGNEFIEYSIKLNTETKIATLNCIISNELLKNGYSFETVDVTVLRLCNRYKRRNPEDIFVYKINNIEIELQKKKEVYRIIIKEPINQMLYVDSFNKIQKTISEVLKNINKSVCFRERV